MADLQNTRIYGYLHVYENSVFDGDVIAKGALTSNRLILTQINDGTEGIYGETSTPPLEVLSMGRVINLNSDLLDDKHGSWYLDLTNASNYLLDANLKVNEISLNKLKNINSKTLLGRLDAGNGPVSALVQSEVKPIFDLDGTNRGDQAVFTNVNIVNYGGTTEIIGPIATAPLSYETLVLTDPTALLTDKVGNKDTLVFKMGENVKFTPISNPENGILVQVGVNLTNNILKGSVNSNATIASYSPYTTQQLTLSLDTSANEPYLLNRLNINAAAHVSKLFVTDLINVGGVYVADSNKFSEALTTKKTETEISSYYRLAFFNASTYNEQGQNVGYNIVKSPIRFDDNSYTTTNILSAKKIRDDFNNFGSEVIETKIHDSVATIEILLNLDVTALEDCMLILVRNEGLYRLSKFETNYTVDDGVYVLSIPGHPDAKWIKIADKIGYHNTTGNVQGGNTVLDEFYHMSNHQHEQLHDKESDNQFVKSGRGMSFTEGNKNVEISLGFPESINSTTVNAINENSHTHTLETYDLESVNPIILTDGMKVLGNKGSIGIMYATLTSPGIVQLSNSYSGTSEYTVPTEKTLSRGLATVVHGSDLSTTGDIPIWIGDDGLLLDEGYQVSTVYDDFVDATYAALNNSLTRADVIKQYVDDLINAINSQDILIYKGAINCSTNPNYPDGNAGDSYTISVPGKIGGASGETVESGDMLICNTDDSVTGDHATVGSNWNIIQTNKTGIVTNTTSSIANNFAIFNDTTGMIIKDSTYNANSFQPKNVILTNLSGTLTSGLTVYNSSSNIWTTKTISTEAVGSTAGLTVTNGDGLSAGNIMIKHADTSTQSSITAVNDTTWISALTLDDYGHLTAISTKAHPTTTTKTVDFDATGTTETVASGIKILDTLDIINDTLGHVTSLSATTKYLPIATTALNGILDKNDWTIFNNKIKGAETTVIGNIPIWNDVVGKTLAAGYSIENSSLSDTTINASTLPTTNLLNNYTLNRINYKGQKDYSTTPDYPTGITGDMYIASVNGKIGGINGKNMYIGDILLCISDDTVGEIANWTIYRKDKMPLKKVIVPVAVVSFVNIDDMIDNTSNYNITIYRNGVYQLESDGVTAYDYSLNRSTGKITLTTDTTINEIIVIIINEYC